MSFAHDESLCVDYFLKYIFFNGKEVESGDRSNVVEKIITSNFLHRKFKRKI